MDLTEYELILVNEWVALTQKNSAGCAVERAENAKNSQNGHGDVLWMGKCLRISVYKKQKFEKIFPGKVGWHRSFKLELALAQ